MIESSYCSNSYSYTGVQLIFFRLKASYTFEQDTSQGCVMFIQKWINALLLIVFTCTVQAKLEPNAEIQFSVHDKTTTFTLAEIQKALPTYTVTLFNPVYKKTITYRAFKFRQVAKLANIDIMKAQQTSIISKDDYQAVLERSILVKYPNPWLAFEELGAPKEQAFTLAHEGVATSNPAPFYLLWQESSSYKMFPWPYAINHIVVNNEYDPYFEVTPAIQENKDIQHGFALFKVKCIACHSINLVGGKVGPELNIPKNITEYRNLDFLQQWIKDSNAFRARSKMPSFSELSDQDIESILAYIESMKTRKATEKLDDL